MISTEPFSKSPLDGFHLINLIAVLWRPHRRSVFKQWSDINSLIQSISKFTKSINKRVLLGPVFFFVVVVACFLSVFRCQYRETANYWPEIRLVSEMYYNVLTRR